MRSFYKIAYLNFEDKTVSLVIKYKTVGLIVSGEYAGQYIKIFLKPEDGSDGCLIYRSPNNDFRKTVYDFWLETLDDIPACFEELNWVVEWLE